MRVVALWVVVSTVGSFTPIAQAQATSPGDAALTEVRKQTDQLEAARISTETNLQAALDAVRQQVASSLLHQQKVEALEKRVAALQACHSAYAERERVLVDERYKTGEAILDAMLADAGWQNVLATALEADITFEQATDVWSDVEFRNGWNKVRDWLTPVGIGLSASSSATFSEGNKGAGYSMLVSGAAIAGVSQLLAGVLGAEGKLDAQKLRSKIVRLEVSKRAYDDLKTRQTIARDMFASVQGFSAQVETLRSDYVAWKDADVETKERGVQKVIHLYDSWRAMLDFIPAYAEQIVTSANQYMKAEGLSEQQRRDLDDAVKKAKSLSTAFNNLLRIFDKTRTKLESITAPRTVFSACDLSRFSTASRAAP